MLATLILGVVILAVTQSTLAGARHHAYADQTHAALRAAESLVEEITSRPYQAQAAAPRSGWGLPDFHGLSEPPGSLRDASASLLPEAYQALARSVIVTDHALDMGSLGADPVQGRLVIVTTRTPLGDEVTLERFIAAPTSEISP